MKTKRLWAHFIHHSSKHSWLWKPRLVKAKMIYNSGNKTWQVPEVEISWLFFVIQITFYSRKKEYNGYCEPDIKSLEERIYLLQEAISLHKSKTKAALPEDIELWSVIEQ